LRDRPNFDVFRRDYREKLGVTACAVNSVDRQGPKGGKYATLPFTLTALTTEATSAGTLKKHERR
jgi:hypothetical protein